MRRTVLFGLLVLLSIPLFAEKEPARPRILGIVRVHILVTDLAEARSFYTKVLGPAQDCNWCERVPDGSIFVNATQVISLSAAPSSAPSNLIEEITFATDDLPKLRRYLIARNIAVSKPGKPTDNYLSVSDPEGHRIAFVPGLPELTANQTAALEVMFPSKLHIIIHAGFVVRDRDAEDHFYKDVLGFHVYWHGGMKDDQTDWVDMQVPDGTDWLEYMLNVSASASKKELGVMNHIAIGVADIKSATERLRDDNVVPILEQPKIGRDGKWQLNLYDPDDTRVELMEFTPTQKPCCSEYTGPHPGQKP